jgi:hypothetical protein
VFAPPAERELQACLLAGVWVLEFFDGVTGDRIGEQNHDGLGADVDEGVDGRGFHGAGL